MTPAAGPSPDPSAEPVVRALVSALRVQCLRTRERAARTLREQRRGGRR